jgi:signal transduction histidine kinase
MASHAEMSKKTLSYQVTTYLLTAVFLTVVSLLGCMAWISHDLNLLAAQSSHTMVAGGFEALRDKLASTTIDYAWWEEAYKNIRDHDDEWVYNNMGLGIVETEIADVMLIVQPDGTKRYGWRIGKGETPDTTVLPPDVVDTLVSSLAEVPLDPVTVKTVNMSIHGNVQVLAAARVTPSETEALKASDLPILIMGYDLTPERLEAIGKTFLIDDLAHSTIHDPDAESVAIKGPNGETIAYLTWTPERPWNALLLRSAVPVIIALLLLGIVAYVAHLRIRETAAELEKSMARVAQASHAKSDFMANMSHELRTPLNAIIGFSDVLLHGVGNPRDNTKFKEYLEDINASGQHLLALINDVLDLSKIEAGAEELDERDVAVGNLARSILRILVQRAEEGGVELAFEAEEPLPQIRADQRKLQQAFLNLLSNAIKFTAPGGTVTFRIRCDAETGIVFEVADTGIGIAPQDIPKALSKFGQIESAMNRKFGGTGLGLPLTAAIAELHGGRFDLRSELGAGTTAAITLPPERVQWPLDAVGGAAIQQAS